MGCATAYFLTTRMGIYDVTVVEVSGQPASQASGKAGGFLARDWCGGHLSPLAERSFDLHGELAAELGAEAIGYRKLATMSVEIRSNAVSAADDEAAPHDECWLDASSVRKVSTLGDERTTAQVHPKLLTEALMVASSATIVKGKAEGVVLNGDDEVTAVLVDGRSIDCDATIVAMGPWSDASSRWFPKAGLPRIRGSRAHSVVIKGDVPPKALFLR